MLSFIKPWIPADYRDLLDFISPAAFKVIEWKSAISDLSSLSSGALFGSSEKEKLIENVQPLFPESVIIGSGKGNDEFDPQFLGQRILEIYFGQFRSEKGLFLDLRLSNFSKDKEKYHFTPSNLIYTFSENFRNGMLLTYDGFYLEDDSSLRKGMEMTGLLPKDADEDLFKETRDLLFAHFDTADEQPIRFDIAKFRSSFHDLFMHLKKHDLTLPADFLFLGFYLVTLYLALENLGEEYPVKDCYLASKER